MLTIKEGYKSIFRKQHGKVKVKNHGEYKQG